MRFIHLKQLFFIHIFIIIFITSIYLNSDKAFEDALGNECGRIKLKFQNKTEEEAHRRKMDKLLYETLNHVASHQSPYHIREHDYFCKVRQFPGSTADILSENVEKIRPGDKARTQAQDLFFIIMASKKDIGRAKLQTETWLQWTQGNFIFFADDSEPSLNMVTLPELKNKTSYHDAQHRQLLGAQWLLRNKSRLLADKKWIIAVDDDTWMNIPALLRYLDHFDNNMPLVITTYWNMQILRHFPIPFQVFYNPFIYGGGGVIFSRTAFGKVSTAVYSEKCPFLRTNDGTWWNCLHKLGVPQVFSRLLHGYSLNFFELHHHAPGRPVDYWLRRYINHISYHHIAAGQKELAMKMTRDVAFYWNSPIPACDKMSVVIN